MPHSTLEATGGTIRPATLADLDDLVLLKRIALDPSGPYIAQHQDEFPEDNEEFSTLLFQHYLDPSYEDWHVMVAEAPSLEDPAKIKVVAFAVWNFTYVHKRKYGAQYQPKDLDGAIAGAMGRIRRDVSSRRKAAYREAFDKATKDLFDDVYGNNQLRLKMLEVHPDYMRRGHGSALTRWGMSIAKQEKLALTLTATPMGVLLYSHLGFKNPGSFVTKVTGESEMYESRLMALESETG